MIFTKTQLEGSYVVEIEKHSDKRGFMARTWDKKIFEKLGLNADVTQCNVSYTKKKGTIRGLHFQIKPYEESKLIRCTKGKIFDVIIDLRTDSKTYKKWFSIELSENNHKMLYIPEGFAHGFQTLQNDTEVFYQVTEYHNPNYERGIKWNDNTFSISWPLKPTVISIKDKSWKSYADNILKKRK